MSFLKSCRCWALESHYTVLLSPGVDILSNLNYFPVSRDRNLTKKLQKNSNAALFPVATPTPPPSKKPLHLNIDTCITRNPAVSHHFSQYSTERQNRKHTLCSSTATPGPYFIQRCSTSFLSLTLPSSNSEAMGCIRIPNHLLARQYGHYRMIIFRLTDYPIEFIRTHKLNMLKILTVFSKNLVYNINHPFRFFSAVYSSK